jgi:MFS family permease
METSPATSTAQISKVPFYINRNFALLWGGQAISNVGDFVFQTTLVLWIAAIIAKGQSWAPLAVSGVLLATFIPIFLIGPLAGVFVDRWEKRRTMLAMDATRAVLVSLLLLNTGIISLPVGWQLGLIYAVVFLESACSQFFNPSRFAFIGDVVDEQHRARASGLGQVTLNLAVVIGPPLAAPLLFAFGVQWALIINALSFVVSFLAISAVRPPPRAGSDSPAEQASFFRELVGGLRFFVSNRVLTTILIAVVIAVLGAGCFDALNIFFLTQNLHAPADLYGFIGAAFGVGAILGAILGSTFGQRIGAARMFWLSLLMIGMIFLIYARLTNFALAIGGAFLIGLGNAPLNVAVGPLILHVTPRAYIGRVMAVINPANSLASVVSITLAGTLASTALHGFHATFLGLTFGPIDTIFTGTGLLIVASGVYAMINLRQVRLAGENTPAAAPVETAAAGEEDVH